MVHWLRKFEDVNIGSLLLVISVVSLSTSLLLTFGVTSYIRYRALHDLAREDVQETSKIIFQSLYSAMSQGGSRDKIESVISELGKTFPRLNVSFYSTKIYRSPIVDKQFGSLASDQDLIRHDPDLQKVMKTGKELLLFPTNSAVRNLYPVLGRQECLGCHTDGRVGAVFGVIDVTYPVDELKVRFEYVINSILGYTLLMLAVVFMLLYLALRKLVAVPLREFASTVREIEPGLQLDHKISLHHLVSELKQLSDNFNHLLGTISSYSAKLLEYSTTDTLTGLNNRRKFDEQLTAEINRSNRYGSKFSVLMLDLDDFKHINDNYGHPVGDLALKQVANIMRSSLRKVDLPARLGGDEFAVILPETTEKDALTVAQNLRNRLNASTLEVSVEKIRITCSIGLASYPLHVPDKSKQALYKAMDDTLYKAKHLGKDQVAAPD